MDPWIYSPSTSREQSACKPLWEFRLLDLDAIGVQIAGSGRYWSPDCWIWTLWECRLLDLDAAGVQIAGSGRFGRLDCWIWTLFSRSLQKPPEVSRSLQEAPGAPRSLQKPPEASRSLQEPRLQEPPACLQLCFWVPGSVQELPEASRAPEASRSLQTCLPNTCVAPNEFTSSQASRSLQEPPEASSSLQKPPGAS